LCETSDFLCSVRILSSFYLLLYPLHSRWRTHTLKFKLLPKTVATRLTCQRGKNHMCILRHHFIKYLCKLKFQNIFSHPDWIRTSFVRYCVLMVSHYLLGNRSVIKVRWPLTGLNVLSTPPPRFC
jgi:hypothetical protein